jgi:methyltransferase
MVWYALLIAAVAVERVAELVVSQSNLAWSRAAAASSSVRGAVGR